MDIDDSSVRAAFESLQYGLFFGTLVVFGVLETILALGRDGVGRRARWPANIALTTLNILVLGSMPVSVLAVADLAMSHGWGLLNLASLPPIASFLLGIALRSLVAYGIHVAMHKVPLLWRVHRIHHTDTQMDVSTTVRFHPLEFAVSMPILLAATLALGIPPFAIMIYELLDVAMAVFTHANIRVSDRLDRALRLVLITPSMHRIHHSAWQPETDSNYGATLSWWDRLFGTYRTRAVGELAAIRLGLVECSDRRATSLRWLIALPFLSLPDPGGDPGGRRPRLPTVTTEQGRPG